MTCNVLAGVDFQGQYWLADRGNILMAQKTLVTKVPFIQACWSDLDLNTTDWRLKDVNGCTSVYIR